MTNWDDVGVTLLLVALCIECAVGGYVVGFTVAFFLYAPKPVITEVPETPPPISGFPLVSIIIGLLIGLLIFWYIRYINKDSRE